MLGLYAGVGGTYVVGEGGRGCETVQLPTTVGKREGEACGVSEGGTHPASWQHIGCYTTQLDWAMLQGQGMMLPWGLQASELGHSRFQRLERRSLEVLGRGQGWSPNRVACEPASGCHTGDTQENQ